MKEARAEELVGRSSLLRNTVWLVWSGGVNIVNSVVLWVAMAHWRDPSEVGQLSTVMSVYAIFMTLCSLGLSSYLAGEIARRNDRVSFVASAISLIGCWSLVSAVAMAVIGYLVNQTPSARLATFVLSLAIVPTGFISVCEAVFVALGRARVIALATTTEGLLRSIIPLVLLYRGHTLPAVCLSFVIIRLMPCLAYAIVVGHRLSDLRFASWQLVMEIVKVAPTFAGVTILAALHWQLGTVLVNKFSGETAAAEFGVASRFLIPVTLLLASFVSVLQPVASRLATRSLADLGSFLSRSLSIVTALGLPLAIGGIFLGPGLLTVLFGERYAQSSASLGLLAVSVIPFGVVMIAARGLVATGRQHIDLLANLVAVLINVVCNIILIPLYGASGSAAAQLFSVTAMAAVEVGAGTRPLFQLRVWQAIWLCRWPLALMVSAILLAQRFGFWWAMTLGGAFYLIGWIPFSRRIYPGFRNETEDCANDDKPRIRILMVGAHLTKTLGGISTVISEILHSPLAREFEFRHLASQADEYSKLGKIELAIRSLIKFATLLVWWRPSLAYIHVGGNASLYRKVPFILLARLLRRRVVTHFHAGDFDFYYYRQPWLGREIIRRGLGLSHLLITVSDHLGQRLNQLLPDSDVTVIPNGIRTAIFNGRQKVSNQHIRLLFVGAMGKLKGECDLIYALEQVPNLESSLRLTLLGDGAETLKPFFQNSGVWPLIEHLGPVKMEERVKYFKRADLFVLPTYAEGMPVAVIEAMAAGLPVIATRVGGIPELIDDGVEGYLVAPGDVEALADRIARLIRDPSERQRMGKRGQVKARKFDEKLILTRLGAQLRLATGRIR